MYVTTFHSRFTLIHTFCDALQHSNIVGLAMSVVIIFSYLIILAPAREHIENSMIRYDVDIIITLKT